MITILHKDLKLSPSLCKQPHKDKSLVCKKRVWVQGNNLSSFETICLAMLVKTCLDIYNMSACQASSTFQSPLQHSGAMQRDLSSSKEPLLMRMLGHLHWCHPAGSVPERHYPDEKHVCFIQKRGLPQPQLLQHQNPRWRKELLIFLGAVLTKKKVSFHLSRKNALNKWIIHKCPHTVCLCNRNSTEQQQQKIKEIKNKSTLIVIYNKTQMLKSCTYLITQKYVQGWKWIAI